MPIPPITGKNEQPAPGTRFRERLSLYANAGLSAPEHVVYLPRNWTPSGRRWPVLVEYAGNRYRGTGIDGGELILTGLATDCRMGYHLSAQPGSDEGGLDCIWVCMPFIQYDPACPFDVFRHTEAPDWFGLPTSAPYPERVNNVTGMRLAAAYLRQAVADVCRRYAGDPTRVVFTGFSRGAVAGGCVGRFDDATASLFRGFILHSHHDSLNGPNSPHDPDLARLRRTTGRPSFLSWGTVDSGAEPSREAAALLAQIGSSVATCEIIDLPHTDEWVLDAAQTHSACHAARDAARRFLQDLLV